MFKRVFSVFIVSFIVLSSFLVVGASEGSDNGLVPVDLLDYSTFNGTGRNYGYLQSSNNFTFSYYAPVNFTYWYVDTIFELEEKAGKITSVSGIYAVGSSGTTTLLTYKHLGDGVWRAYGVLPNRYSSGYCGIKVTCSSTYFLASVQKLDVYTITSNSSPDRGEIYCPQFNDYTSWVSMSSPGTTIGDNFLSLGFSDYTHFNLQSSCVNWRSFDYIDFSFRYLSATIDSISVYISSSSDPSIFHYVPFEYQFINGSSIGPNDYCKSGQVITSSQQSFAETERRINLRLFIPAEYRNSGSLYIDFTGSYSWEAMASYAYLDSVTGYYCVHDYDPTLIKLDQIKKAIEDSMSSDAQQNASSNDFKESMGTSSDTMQQNQDTLNNVQKPSATEVGSIASADSVINVGGNGIQLLVQMLSPITNSRIVIGILTMVATLALVGYVFFGKKK